MTTSVAGAPLAVGPRTREILARRQAAIPRGVGHMSEIVAESAEGPYLVDVDGHRYIDFAGGIGALNVGHRHPRVMRRIEEQLGKLHHVAIGVALTEPYVEVCERLCRVAPGAFPKKAILLTSGAEAIENAVKIARAATGRPAIVAFEGGYHGRTLLAMSLTAKAHPYKIGFGPFAPEIYRAPFAYPYRCPQIHDAAACAAHSAAGLERLLTVEVDPASVAAVIVEPVQGEGGFIVPPPEFLRSVQEICRRHEVLLIVDEIQTGFGRTGTMFACEQVGLEPDLLVVGKSLADGMPLTAVVGRAEVMDDPIPGSLGGTYTGNPVACAAALGVFEAFEQEEILGAARRVGAIVEARFRDWAGRCELIGDVRCMGAMAALELVRDRRTKEPAAAETTEVLRYAHRHGLLLIKAGLWDNVVRVLMPLNIPEGVLDEGLRIMEDALLNARESRTTG